MPANKTAVIFVTLIILLPLCGCWSNYEIDDRAIIAALGVDKGSNGRLLVTAQIIIPSQFAGVRQSGGEMQSGGKKSVFIASAEARTISDAISSLALKSGRKSFLSFMDVVVVGSDLARNPGMEPVIDWIVRDRQANLRTLLCVADGKAGVIIESTGSGLENVPAYFLSSAARVSFKENSKVLKSDVFSVGNAVIAGSRAPVLARVVMSKASEKEQARFSGGAVFKGFRLAGWLTETEVRGYLWLRDEIGRGFFSDVLPGGMAASFEIRGTSTKVSAEIVGGRPVFRVGIRVKSSIQEVHQASLSLDNPKKIRLLDKIVEKHVAEEAAMALKKARKLKADIFGFGEILHDRYPKEWKKLGKDWGKMFPQVPVKIEVKATIRRTGRISNPIRPQG